MTTIETRRRTPAKGTNSAKSAKAEKPKAPARSSAQAAPSKADASGGLRTPRVSKHDCILALLSRRDGATISEMMEASGWQQHSVRGFLAGTVKKKLGFLLTSSKSDGELRRYSIDTRRGR